MTKGTKKRKIYWIILIAEALLICILIKTVNMDTKKRIEKANYMGRSILELTPEECVDAYIYAHNTKDVILFRELCYKNYDDTDSELFTFIRTSLIPTELMELKINNEITNAMVSKDGEQHIYYDAIVKFVNEDGEYAEIPYVFRVIKESEDSPWKIYDFGF